MIEKLPAESDPQYTEAYTVAQDTSAVAYVGKSQVSEFVAEIRSAQPWLD